MKYGAIFAIVTIIGTAVMSIHWSNIERENNAFAKECNDRGGFASFGFSARQCLMANNLPTHQPAAHASDKGGE